MRMSHKAKDAAAEKQSYACDTFSGHGRAHQPPLPGSPVAVSPVTLLGRRLLDEGPVPLVSRVALISGNRQGGITQPVAVASRASSGLVAAQGARSRRYAWQRTHRRGARNSRRTGCSASLGLWLLRRQAAIDRHVRPEPPSCREAMVIASCTWSTPSVNALLAGLIGIAATLFQSRTAERAHAFERDERLRYEQVNACSAYATAVTELKRGLITLWFYQRRDAAGADYQATRIECDRLGAGAEAARFRVQLVLGDPEVMMLADAAFTAAGALGRSTDRDELRERENRFEAAVTMFTHAASRRLRMTASASAPGSPGQDAPTSAT
jgi:hypothetical protein